MTPSTHSGASPMSGMASPACSGAQVFCAQYLLPAWGGDGVLSFEACDIQSNKTAMGHGRAELRDARISVTDLEVGGQLDGLSVGSTRYLSRGGPPRPATSQLPGTRQPELPGTNPD